jgi:predicted membrane-bound spermidine synthase
MQGFPGVESIDVVEINPAYLDLTRSYPELAPLLDDPRIHIHIDDGRRWLKRNPHTRYDLIVQNITYHWRANAGNLLSREYLSEVRTHLNPVASLPPTPPVRLMCWPPWPQCFRTPIATPTSRTRPITP